MISHGKNLLLFNPESDFALAVNSRYYTPPAKVIKLRQHLTMLPSLWAKEGDLILIDDSLKKEELDALPYFHNLTAKSLKTIKESEIKDFKNEIVKVKPWGWNVALRKKLIEAGLNEEILPSEEKIESLRELSHRRTAIRFRKRLNELSPWIKQPEGVELLSLKEAREFKEKFNGAYFKAPWSSSGRGVINSSRLSDQRFSEWIKGCLHKQGSVIAEENRGRKADFASEWWLEGRKAEFRGLSFFLTTPGGSYIKNLWLPQHEIERKIEETCKNWNNKILSIQKLILEEIIAPYYEGPAGIDMLSDNAGMLNACVEINLRYTMGFIGLGIETEDFD